MPDASKKPKLHGSILQQGHEGCTHTQLVTRAVFNRESRHIATSGAEGIVKIWTVEECEPILSIEVDNIKPKRVSSVAFNSDGRFVITGDWGSHVKVFDVKQGKCVMKFEQAHTGKVTAVAFKKDNKLLLSGGEDYTCRLYDPRAKGGSGGAFHAFRAPDEVLDVHFAPDGHGVIGALRSKELWCWDQRKGDEPVVKYVGHTDWVNSVACSPDGKTLLSGSTDKTMRLWDLASGVCKQTYGPHQESVNCVRYYGELLVAAQGNRFWESANNSLAFWDPGSAELMSTVEGHSDALNSVDVSVTTGRLVTAGMDRTARLWEVVPQRPKKKKKPEQASRHQECPNGCGKELPGALVQEHLDRECPLRELQCKFCGESIKAREMLVHEQRDCSNRPVVCECGETMRLSQKDEHDQTSCRTRKVECDMCGMPVRAEDIGEHQARICQERLVLCSKGCGVKIRASDILRHQTEECAQRSVECEQCGSMFVIKDEVAHRKKYCTGRLVSCEKCGEEIVAMMLDRHERRDCPKRMVPCTLACGMSLPAEEMEEHTSRLCHRRPVPCKWADQGCDEEIPLDEVDVHARECLYRVVTPPPPEPEYPAYVPTRMMTWATDKSNPDYKGPPCSKCGVHQKACKDCQDDYCVSCLSKSGLPSRGLCKLCTRKDITKLRQKASSPARLKF